MIVPVRCFTCGKVIADKYDYYLEKVNELMLKKENKDVSVDEINKNEILNDLNMNRYCCRRICISTEDMMNII
jgi:DNA-directed RNA polymerase subunit N